MSHVPQKLRWLLNMSILGPSSESTESESLWWGPRNLHDYQASRRAGAHQNFRTTNHVVPQELSEFCQSLPSLTLLLCVFGVYKFFFHLKPFLWASLSPHIGSTNCDMIWSIPQNAPPSPYPIALRMSHLKISLALPWEESRTIFNLHQQFA